MKKLFLIVTAALALIATTAHADFSTDFPKTVGDIIDGPWVIGGGYLHSGTGTGANIAVGVVSYNLMPSTNGLGFNSGPIVGYEDCWAKGQSHFNSLSGGWNLSYSGKPLAATGISWMTNDTATIVLSQMLATPRGGNAIGAVTATAVSLDVAHWKNLHFKPTFLYSNRSGQPGFNGSFYGGGLFLSLGF